MQTVSHVNRMLYEHGDYINVNIGQVLKRNIFASHSIETIYHVDPDMVVNVNLTMPMAILLNEVAQDIHQADMTGVVEVKSWVEDDVLYAILSSPDIKHIVVSISIILEMLVQQSAAQPIETDDPEIFFGIEMPLRDVSGSVATKIIT